jgi:hypothetical protein
MTSPSDLGARLRAAGEELPVGRPPIEQIVRRGRKRLAVKITSYGVALAVVLLGMGLGIASLRGLSNPNIRLPDGTMIPKPSVELSMPLGGASRGVATAAGAVWIADYEDAAVLRVDPALNRVTATIPMADTAYDIVAGEGAVWALESDAVERIDPLTNRVVASIPLDGTIGGVAVRGYGGGITVGGGSVWVMADLGRQQGLDRIDPGTNRVADRVPWTSGLADDYSVLFAGDAVWVGSCEAQDAVYRVRDGRLDRIVLPSPTKVVLDGCLSRFVAQDRILWTIAEPNKRADSLLRGIDLATGKPLGTGVGLPKSLISAAAFDGAFWITYEQGSGVNRSTVLRIVDPASGKFLSAPIPLGSLVGSIGFADGSVWVAVGSARTGHPAVIRIHP